MFARLLGRKLALLLLMLDHPPACIATADARCMGFARRLMLDASPLQEASWAILRLHRTSQGAKGLQTGCWTRSSVTPACAATADARRQGSQGGTRLILSSPALPYHSICTHMGSAASCIGNTSAFVDLNADW
eukprot:TRINITY_DN74481_c0_g1_i1.p1 TRINITY_DN74481_c0_g1~~TRINITY_DN74481_c0_g1_i1.p1  ORF type:complete len:133 (-),score=18.13 TRINITY_DN74481_c0_g1_i1:9-407(-)